MAVRSEGIRTVHQEQPPVYFEWGVARPRKAVRKMPTERDARDTVRIAVETWGPEVGWRVMYRKLGGIEWSEAA